MKDLLHIKKLRLIHILISLQAIVLILVGGKYFSRPFGWDEMEHIHTVFLISDGEIPYQSFFQHHHPLLWYLVLPFWNLLDSIDSKLFFIKIFSFSIGILNLFLIFLLSNKIFFILNEAKYLKNTQEFRKFLGLITTLFISTNFFFIQNSLDFRPDNLMFMFFFLSLLLLLKSKPHFFWSGFFLSLSFITLQKVILLFPIYLIVLVFSEAQLSCTELRPLSTAPRQKKTLTAAAPANSIHSTPQHKNLKIPPSRNFNKNLTKIFKNLFGFTIPLIIFLLLILTQIGWENYYFYNWTLNANFQDEFSVLHSIKNIPEKFKISIYLYLIIFLISLILLIRKKFWNKWNRPEFLEIILYINLFLIFELAFIIKSLYFQYFLPLMFTGGILTSAVFLGIYGNLNGKNRNKKVQRNNYGILIFLLFLLLQIYPITKYQNKETGDLTYAEHVNIIRSISEKTDEEKLNIKTQYGNLFYNQQKFFWYSPEAEESVKSLRQPNP